VAHCGKGQAVSQLHLGGGTPTFLSDAELTQLMDMLRATSAFEAVGEYSIEVDPAPSPASAWPTWRSWASTA
jgi:oxygen-independent coproporphyrinogen-3 oxidase